MTETMQPVRKINHRLFVATLLAKAALGVIQVATAAAIFAGMAEKLPTFTQWLFKAELAENPTDFIATRIISMVGAVPASDLTFYTTYFSAHGALHIAIVIALLFGAAWAHRATVVVLWAFVAYQMIEWSAVGGTTLLVLSMIDLAVSYIALRDQRENAAQIL